MTEKIFRHYGAVGRYSGSEPSSHNITTDPTGSKWADWIGYDQPGVGVIGAYEGAGYHETGLYRPSWDSKMRSLGKPFDAIAREQFIRRFYTYVDPIDSHTGNTVPLVNTPYLQCDVIDPAIISVDWTVNDRTFTNAGETLDFSFDYFAFGTYTVSARAYDPTDWVRGDRSQLEQTVTWTVINKYRLNGGERNDTLVGNDHWNIIEGRGGNDVLFGGAGDDHLSAGAGGDRLDGGTGFDKLDGGAGHDILDGGSGNDTLRGGDGDDRLTGGTGDDEFQGGDGIDTACLTGTAAATVDLSLRTVQNTGLGYERFLEVENVTTGSGSDRLFGSDAANLLDGAAGDDQLEGRAGNDILHGGDGHDTLYGNTESDTLNGGMGNDFLSGGADATFAQNEAVHKPIGFTSRDADMH